MTRPWNGIVSAQDAEVYRRVGFGLGQKGIGRRPALLVIDVQYREMGEAPKPILEAIEEYPTSCGEYGWAAVHAMVPLIAAFRARSLPVLYPHVAMKEPSERGRWEEMVPGVLKVGARGYEFVAEIAPVPGDIRLPKLHPSSFFGTPLASHLINLGVDSVVVAGCTTSGCVRATVVDAFSLNYPVVVPEECVFDRVQVSHAINLFDMASKYAAVMPTQSLIGAIEALPAP